MACQCADAQASKYGAAAADMRPYNSTHTDCLGAAVPAHRWPPQAVPQLHILGGCFAATNGDIPL
jgi:hypothetical protein